MLLGSSSSCPAITQLQNGVVTGNRYSCGANITFSCHRGFYLVGRSVIYCLSNGNWSSSMPNCSGKWHQIDVNDVLV